MEEKKDKNKKEKKKAEPKEPKDYRVPLTTTVRVSMREYIGSRGIKWQHVVNKGFDLIKWENENDELIFNKLERLTEGIRTAAEENARLTEENKTLRNHNVTLQRDRDVTNKEIAELKGGGS